MKINILLLTLVCGLTLPALSQGVFADDDEEDVAVAIESLPAVVMSAVTQVFPSGTIQKAEKDSEDQSVLFDVKVRSEETLYSVEVTPEGKLIQVEVDDEDQVGQADDESDDESDDDGHDLQRQDDD